jgi:hypothetical protein
MAGIDFDRQVFASAPEPPSRRLPLQALGPALFVLALSGVGLIGFKIYTNSFRPSSAGPASEEIAQLRQHVDDLQKRLDRAEKLRKSAQADSAPTSQRMPVVVQKPAPRDIEFRSFHAPCEYKFKQRRCAERAPRQPRSMAGHRGSTG